MMSLTSWHVRSISSLILLLLAASCAEPTPYVAAVNRDGYAETAVEDNRYRVRFAGNSLTSRDTVETYLLYRAAEVTRAAGKDWFRVADRDTEAEIRFRSFSTSFGRGGFGFYSSRAFGMAGGTTTRPITRYEAFADILVFAGSKPEDDPLAYDARSVLATLEPEIHRPNERER